MIDIKKISFFFERKISSMRINNPPQKRVISGNNTAIFIIII